MWFDECQNYLGGRGQFLLPPKLPSTCWVVLTPGDCEQSTVAQWRLDSFFCPKVPRLEKRVDDDGNSGGDNDEEDNLAFKATLKTVWEICYKQRGWTPWWSFQLKDHHYKSSLLNILWWNGRQRNHEEFFPHQSWATSNFVPLMFLRGPGTPQGKILVRTPSWHTCISHTGQQLLSLGFSC